jgi:hypothetical protein
MFVFLPRERERVKEREREERKKDKGMCKHNGFPTNNQFPKTGFTLFTLFTQKGRSKYIRPTYLPGINW